MGSYYAFNFPPVKTKRDVNAQIAKIGEESNEVSTAKTDLEIIEETLDTVQACETLLRMFDETTVHTVKARVICKNAKRGYYGSKGV